jgi:hypothetical protein
MQDTKWMNPAPALASSAAAAAAAAGLPRLPYNRRANYKKRTPEELAEDAIKLADQVYDLSGRLRRERDERDKTLLDAQSKLRFCRGWNWVLGSAIVLSWAVTWALVQIWLVPVLEKVAR